MASKEPCRYCGVARRTGWFWRTLHALWCDYDPTKAPAGQGGFRLMVTEQEANRVLADERAEHGRTMRRLGEAVELLRRAQAYLPLYVPAEATYANSQTVRDVEDIDRFLREAKV